MTPPTVLITGAASGIGRETARLLAASGWQCVLVDRDAPGLDAVVAGLPAPAGAPHIVRAVDLTDAAQIAALPQGLPPLDALINNAGMSDPSGVALAEQPVAQLDRLLALNLHAPQRLAAACLPLFRPGARVVNVSSGAGLHAIPWRGAYSPSKAGVIALTQALSAARPDLVVNALCPGFVRTELVDGLIAAGRLDPAEAVSKIPLGRMAVPQEMARVLRFLASPGAAALRGQIVPVDGGTSVYGGSRKLAPATLEALPLDLPLALQVAGDGGAWSALATSASGPAYAAVFDPTPLASPEGGLVHAVHATAARFAARHGQQASLTLLLPAHAPSDWQLAGDAAAARMLVATLACEWGAQHLRINALELPDGTSPAQVQPLLHYMASAQAQYLTGQTLRCAAS